MGRKIAPLAVRRTGGTTDSTPNDSLWFLSLAPSASAHDAVDFDVDDDHLDDAVRRPPRLWWTVQLEA
jgi:hypothetical protein